MLVTLSTFALAKQTSLIHTTLNITRSSRLNIHDICTSHIKQVGVNTLAIDQSRIKERHTLQIRISRLPSTGLSRFMNTRAPTRFNGNIVAHHANTRTTPTPMLMSCSQNDTYWSYQLNLLPQGVTKKGNMPACRSRIDPASH